MIPGTQAILAELSRRMDGYGNGLKVARELGIDPGFLRSIKCGGQPVPKRIAEQLGFELRWIKRGEDGNGKSV